MRLPLPLRVEPVHDLLVRLAVVEAVETARVDHRAVVRAGQLAAVDHGPDLDVELGGELEVARVVRRHAHHGAGAVLEQHVVGDPHRDLLARRRIRDRPAQRDARLLAVLVAALLRRLGQRAVHVLVHLRRVAQAQHVRVLGREHEEGGAEERVGPGREDRVVDPELLAAKDHLGALGAADPVPLHRDHVRRPLDRLEVVQQAVGVVGDLEEPLLELPDLDEVAAALTAPVDHLLVGENRLVVRAPLDRRLLAVGEAALVHAQEDPLGPAVVLGLVRAEFARPVDGDAEPAELPAERRDRLVGRLARLLSRLDRVVLGGEAEGVVAHRVEDVFAPAPVEVRHRVPDGVVLQVPDVRLAARVREHLEHVRLRAFRKGRSRPPRCARPPTPSATWARSSSGRTGPRWARVPVGRACASGGGG